MAAQRELIRQPDPGLEIAGEIYAVGGGGSSYSGGSTIIPLSSDMGGISGLPIERGGGGGGSRTPSTVELLQTGPVNITDRYASEVQKYEDLKADYLQTVKEFGENSPEAIVAKMDMGDQEGVVAQIAQDNGFVGYPDGIVTAEAQIEAAENQTIIGDLANSVYDAATSVPVVGDFVKDTVEGVSDWLDDQNIAVVAGPGGVTVSTTPRGGTGGITSGMSTVPYNPVFTTTSGPGATITGGVYTGTVLDKAVSILRNGGLDEETVQTVMGDVAEEVLKGTPEGEILVMVGDVLKDISSGDDGTTTSTSTSTSTPTSTTTTSQEQKNKEIQEIVESADSPEEARVTLVLGGYSLEDLYGAFPGIDKNEIERQWNCADPVYAADNPQICGFVDPPREETICPEGTDLAGQEAPEGNLDNCNIAGPSLTCPEGTDLAGQVAPDGNLDKCNIGEPPPPEPTICPEGTDLAGQVAPDGNLDECNISVLPEPPEEPPEPPEEPTICPDDSDTPGVLAPEGNLDNCYIDTPPPPFECPEGQVRNPETGECEFLTTDPCDNPVYAYFNPEICGGVQTPSTSLPSGSRNVRVTGPELAQIDYLYDIGGESIFKPNMVNRPYTAKNGGIIDTYNEFDELIDLLRG